MNEDMAYHLGVFMGDGYVENYSPSAGNGKYIGLKAIDKDFVQHWQEVLSRLTGKKYSIRDEKPNRPNHNIRYRCRSGNSEFVANTLEQTESKTKIPTEVMSGTAEVKKQFIQGLMDSEAWITCLLRSLGPSNISLSLGVSSPWAKDVHKLFADIGIGTSKIYVKKGSLMEKYYKGKQQRKDFYGFEIDILDYIGSGLGFNIKRKNDRLDYCSRILRDHTRDYPKYSTYLKYHERGG